MDPAEYENIARLEGEHWYYRGKRRIVRTWIRRFSPPETQASRLLDCGAGTGLFASEMSGDFEAYVADDHQESLDLLGRKFATDRIIKIGEHGIEAPDEFFNVITALDVLEHIENDQNAVNGIRKILKPNGIFVATVPASMALWSDWDESLHHFRRYSRQELGALFSEGWEILHINYTNTAPYPAVWFLRKIRRIFSFRKSKIIRSEDKVPFEPLNRLLEWIFFRTGVSKVRFPFGVSLIVVARRNG